jgi:hypothetical protein
VPASLILRVPLFFQVAASENSCSSIQRREQYAFSMRGWGSRVPNLGHVGPNGPLSSQSPLYFPNLADGGPAAGQCQTLFSFVNPNNSPIPALLVWNADKGSPLSLDFGTGAHSQFTFSIAPHGTIVFASKIGSPVTVTGWAVARSTLAVQGTVAFRLI